MRKLRPSFSSWPCYSSEEIQTVTDILSSGKVNYWTGSECRKFEKEFSAFTKTKFAIALANGTVALDAALKALEVGPGDEVIVTSRSFIATVSCIVNAGATPKFADVMHGTQNIHAESIKRVLTKRTKAIICVHLAGWPCDMDPIVELASKNGIYIIEDCAQAHGANYKGKPVGSIGDIGCWSFCQDKIISTGGEGGMVTTNNQFLWSKMWSFKDHGKNWSKTLEKNSSLQFRWIHDSFGTNWRMSEIQGAIGRLQLNRLPEWNKKRIKYAKQIWAAANETTCLLAPTLSCDGCDGNCTGFDRCRHAAYKCYVFFKGPAHKRDEFIKKINSKGVPCFSGTCSEIYMEKAFENTGFRPEKRLTVAKELGETSLMFLCHPNLSQQEIDKTCHEIKQVANSMKY